jgi:hypothetical protein
MEEVRKLRCFWGTEKREVIEKTLRPESDGSYCLRQARDGSICLSMKYIKVHHLKLVVDKEGIVSIGLGQKFPSIRYFLDELATKQLPIKLQKDDKQSVTVTLQFPINPSAPVKTSVKEIPKVQNMQKVFTKTSNMEKLSDSMFGAKWQQRYFILVNDQLSWYANDAKEKLHGSIPLKEVQAVSLQNDHKGKPLSCVVATHERQIYFTTNMDTLVREWHSIIGENLDQVRRERSCF